MLQRKTCSILLASLSNFGITSAAGGASSVTLKRKNSTLGKAIQYFRFNYMFNCRHHLDNDKWAKIFAIEGNIGVGKNDFGKKFSEALDLKFYPTTDVDYIINRLRGKYPDEFIDYTLSPDSVHKAAYNLSMDYFTENPKDWIHSSNLQIYMLRNRFYQYYDALEYLLRTGRGVVTNRSYYTDRVFADAQRKLRWLPSDVYEHYDCLTILFEQEMLHPQVVIYLDVPAEECYENVQASNNERDKRLPLDFYKRIEQAYKEIYFNFAKARGVNVIEIDWRNPAPVDEIVEYIDELKELEAPNSSWKNKDNNQLKRIMKACQDEDYRDDCCHLFTHIDELWFTREHQFSSEEEYYAMPFGRRKGFNPKLGDKGYFWKYY